MSPEKQPNLTQEQHDRRSRWRDRLIRINKNGPVFTADTIEQLAVVGAQVEINMGLEDMSPDRDSEGKITTIFDITQGHVFPDVNLQEEIHTQAAERIISRETTKGNPIFSRPKTPSTTTEQRLKFNKWLSEHNKLSETKIKPKEKRVKKKGLHQQDSSITVELTARQIAKLSVVRWAAQNHKKYDEGVERIKPIIKNRRKSRGKYKKKS